MAKQISEPKLLFKRCPLIKFPFEKIMSIIRKYHNHTLQPNTEHCEAQPKNTYSHNRPRTKNLRKDSSLSHLEGAGVGVGGGVSNTFTGQCHKEPVIS